MKKNVTMFMAAALMTGSMALAADQTHKENETVDTSVNPITKTETTTHKYEQKIKGPNGEKGDMKVNEKTKVKKDGSSSSKVKVEANTESGK